MNLESISRLSRSVPPPPAAKTPGAKVAKTEESTFETTQNIAQYQRMMEKMRAIPEIRPDKVEQAKAYLAQSGGISNADATATAEAMLTELGLDLDT